MKHQYKNIYIASKAILFFYISGITFKSMSAWDCSAIHDSVTLESVTVIWGSGQHHLSEQDHLKDINLHVKRLGCIIPGSGCSTDLPGGQILLPNSDTLWFSGCRPIFMLEWKTRFRRYLTYVDSAALQRLNDAISPLDSSFLERWVPPYHLRKEDGSFDTTVINPAHIRRWHPPFHLKKDDGSCDTTVINPAFLQSRFPSYYRLRREDGSFDTTAVHPGFLWGVKILEAIKNNPPCCTNRGIPLPPWPHEPKDPE